LIHLLTSPSPTKESFFVESDEALEVSIQGEFSMLQKFIQVLNQQVMILFLLELAWLPGEGLMIFWDK
jgi:hypothetical protein